MAKPALTRRSQPCQRRTQPQGTHSASRDEARSSHPLRTFRFHTTKSVSLAPGWRTGLDSRPRKRIMARPKAELRLGAFFNPTGHHVASWRHPNAQADAGINFKHYVEIAQTAERGKFDMIFLADNVCVR